MVEKISFSRRSFLTRIWIGLGIVALLQVLAGAVTYFVSGRKRAEKNTSELLQVGIVTDFPPGSVTLIARGHLYLSRLDDGGFLAISRKCTHLGCAVPWIAERKQFECPCHASVFDINGQVPQSPAPRALDLYPISFEKNMAIIYISTPIKRTGFIHEHLVMPQRQAKQCRTGKFPASFAP